MKILIVDDNQSSLDLLDCMLEMIDLCRDVIKVENGAEALEAIRKDYYDLVFMDIRMPVMTGIESAKIIRSEGNHNTYLIALTAGGGDSLEEERQRVFEAGFDDYVAKPFNFEMISNAVVKFYSHKKASMLKDISC